jgi:hypothetical protein
LCPKKCLKTFVAGSKQSERYDLLLIGILINQDLKKAAIAFDIALDTEQLFGYHCRKMTQILCSCTYRLEEEKSLSPNRGNSRFS